MLVIATFGPVNRLLGAPPVGGKGNLVLVPCAVYARVSVGLRCKTLWILETRALRPDALDQFWDLSLVSYRFRYEPTVSPFRCSPSVRVGQAATDPCALRWNKRDAH